MVNVLLKRIRNLEKELKEIKEKNRKVKELIVEVCKDCKIEKSKKDAFRKKYMSVLSNLEDGDVELFYNEDNSLKYESFLEIAQNITNSYLVIVNANLPEDKKKFLLGFIINKISPFFTKQGDLLIGLVDGAQLKEIKKLNKIPYFNQNTGEFDEIEVFKVVYDIDKFSVQNLQKAKNLFKEFRLRPSYKNKHYIEFSLVTNSIVDFEKEELNKQKAKFAYVMDEKYPNLENLLKREINNLPFVLAVLEKIDSEMDKIKESKGLENIVNRMLNYIELNIPDRGLLDEVRFLRQRLSS